MFMLSSGKASRGSLRRFSSADSSEFGCARLLLEGDRQLLRAEGLDGLRHVVGFRIEFLRRRQRRDARLDLASLLLHPLLQFFMLGAARQPARWRRSASDRRDRRVICLASRGLVGCRLATALLDDFGRVEIAVGARRGFHRQRADRGILGARDRCWLAIEMFCSVTMRDRLATSAAKDPMS